MVKRILPLAEEFLMLGIKRVCEKALINFGNFDLKTVALADLYKLPRLRESALDYVGNNWGFFRLLNDKAFEELEGSSKSCILEKRIQYVFARLPNDIEKLISHFEEQSLSTNRYKIKNILELQCELKPGFTDSVRRFGDPSMDCW